MIRMTLIALLFGVFTSNAEDLAKSKFDGSWDYTASQAPEGYRSGTITINGTELELLIGSYQKYKGYDVKEEKDVLSFYTYVEGTRVTVKLTMKDGEVSGTANSQEGMIPLKLTKKK
ncbi:MAG: hypothetical protein ACFHWX_02650 [Bacteroidota bacterium]